jgi:hypothetical protein
MLSLLLATTARVANVRNENVILHEVEAMME